MWANRTGTSCRRNSNDSFGDAFFPKTKSEYFKDYIAGSDDFIGVTDHKMICIIGVISLVNVLWSLKGNLLNPNVLKGQQQTTSKSHRFK